MSERNPAQGSNEFWVRCPKCSHSWIAAYLPMPVEAFVAVGARAACAKCGNTKGILCGKGEDNPPDEALRGTG